ncbi:DUF5946 family protein [Cohnella sp. REN36]|uniref:DUF5946 family protein n=1 Tax=Cohnella sp. REN36 TaxID=2887347 RepID=UPI001D15042A|nr:DUF5946 family protein [Cohnella sp. REN36]MCC3375141.1 DUF5946 family protein [Cohnella sp. REN36]
MSHSPIRCPGCGWPHGPSPSEAPKGLQASGACFEAYQSLCFYTLSLSDDRFIHQHSLDTYQAQHAGAGMKNITVAFSLIGLYYALEHSFDGRQVQRVHAILGSQKRNWESLLPAPAPMYTVTVHTVVEEKTEAGREAMLEHWMRETWTAWSHRHAWVRERTREWLG